jgi:hypothetical protein
MNLRELVGVDEPYFKFNREERQYAAILFYLLNHANNAERALDAVKNCNWKLKNDEFGIYLEYSYPRDLWHGMDFTDRERKVRNSSIDEVNKRKVETILSLLEQLHFETTLVPQASARDFNAFFIGQSRASKKYIQSPANWHLSTFFGNITSAYSEKCEATVKSALEGVCKLKWAFRVKPDIVIHADRDHALCIELKFESTEGRYPTDGVERKLIQEKKLFQEPHSPLYEITQTEMQTFLMSELLGFDCRYLLITRHNKSDGRRLSWADFLKFLEIPPSLPQYISEALSNFERNSKIPPSLEAEDRSD